MLAEELQSFLLLSVADEVYALPALLVRRVIAHETLMPLPRMAPFVLGVATVSGRVIGVVDLAMLLGHDPSPVEKPYWIIVELPDGHMALAVERVRQTPPGVSIERSD